MKGETWTSHTSAPTCSACQEMEVYSSADNRHRTPRRGPARSGGISDRGAGPKEQLQLPGLPSDPPLKVTIF